MSSADPVLTQKIKERLDAIEAEVERAAEKSGRSSKDVLILAVSKRQPLGIIQTAYAAGLRHFGENYVEEAAEKINQLRELRDIRWEMVGHVQSRKSGAVAADFTRVHSLDSLKLANRLNTARETRQNEPALEVLLQLNVSGEASKEGFPAWEEEQWEAMLPTVSAIQSQTHLRLTGLMAMPPLFDDPQQSRPFLRKLRLAREFFNQQIPHLNLTELSMGTSSDFAVAVEEGATIIRLGQALLGPRNYSIG